MSAADAISWETLAGTFHQPPHSYRPMPFWFWNGAITDDLIRTQLGAMHDAGVDGVYVHCRSGMRPRYLTDEWWSRVDTAVDTAAALTMRLGFVDEFNWPSGEARDFTLDGVPSRVRHADEDYRMRRLVMAQHHRDADLRALQADDVVAIVTGRRDGSQLLPDSLREVTQEVRSGGRAWAGADDGVLFSFELTDATGFDGGTVDLMNPAATDAFIEAFYRPLVERYPTHLGSTIVGTFVDHEGDFGERLAWTPALFESFLARWGYRLQERLPLLVLDEGPAGQQVRGHYMQVVSELYAQNFFTRLREFAEPFGLTVTGHVWEESLLTSAAYQGSHFAIQRSWSMPGVDSLYDWARKARHFKEAATVAHVEDRPLVVEAQGVLGAGGELTPDLVRGTAAMSAVWGAHLLVPHALNSNQERTDFPEDWFLTQPWWPYFGDYLSYASRMCWLNSVGVHRAPVLLYHPIESVWPYTKPAFDDSWNYRIDGVSVDHGAFLWWGNEADEVERGYDTLLEALTRDGLDCDVADAEYVRVSGVSQGRVRLGRETYDVVVLPALTTMDADALEHLASLVDRGATVVSATRRCPSAASGPADQERVDRAWSRLLAEGDRFVLCELEEVAASVRSLAPTDVRALSGGETLRWQRRAVLDGELVSVVNVARSPVDAVLAVPAETSVEAWDPETGERSTLPLVGGGVRLRLGPWQAQVLALRPQDSGMPDDGTAQAAPPAAVRPLQTLDGPWRRTLADPDVSLPWGRVAGTSEAIWLDGQRHGIRDWMVIGPFDYGRDHRGWSRDFGPESNEDLLATLPGKLGPVTWRPHHSDERVVDLSAALGLDNEEWSGARYRTSYATTFVHSQQGGPARLAVVADSNAKAWLNGELVLANRDDHPGYLEMNEGFGRSEPVTLLPGWNRLLVKVNQGLRYGGRYAFTARFTDADGRTLVLPAATTPSGPVPATPVEEIEVDVPAGTVQVELPGLGAASEAWLGDRCHAITAERIDLPQPLATDLVLTIRTAPGDVLVAAPRARVAPVDVALVSLSDSALRYHSGVVLYEKVFEADTALVRAARSVDLGDVGCSARVELNGRLIARRPWPPYVGDLAGALVPGSNRLLVEVANSGAHRRAGQDRGDRLFGLPVSGPELLVTVPLSGLVGPVQLVG